MSDFSMDSFFTVWEPLQARYTAQGKRPPDISTFYELDTAPITMIVQALEAAKRQERRRPADGGDGGRRRYSRRGAPQGHSASHENTRISDHADLEMSARDYASGGMGKVFMGPNHTTGGWCAVKVPHGELINAAGQSAADLKATFEEEALHWCGRWPHPFVVVPGGLTRIPSWGDMPALILQYCPSGSLESRLADAHKTGEPLALCDAFTWAQQAALGLAAIHLPEADPLHSYNAPNAPNAPADLQHTARHGMTHCDVKPANIMIDANGVARVSDLGLARVWKALPGDWRPNWDGPASPTDPRQQQANATWETLSRVNGADTPEEYLRVNAHSRSTRIPRLNGAPEVGSDGPALGTMPYMPPEQWRGMNGVTTASDIYAFGCVLFELFSGVSGTLFVPEFGPRDMIINWYHAHLRDPQRRLSDPDMHALTHGPLSSMMVQRADRAYDATDGVRARRVLEHLDELVQACVARDPQARPTAKAVAESLGKLAEEVRCQRVQTPHTFARTPENEAIFLRQLAATYGQLNRPHEQLRLMQTAAHHMPNDATVQYGLGKAHMDLDQDEQALHAFEIAELRLTSHQVAWATSITYLIHVSKGNLYLKRGGFEKAIHAYEAGLGSQPEGVGALKNLALAYYRWASHALDDDAVRLERLERGLAAVSDALEIEPDFPQARELRDAVQSAIEQIRVP